MADATTTEAAVATQATTGDSTKAAEAATTTAATAQAKAEDATPGADALGDAGKKALDTMKAERKEARESAAAEKARADALQAKLDGKEAEHAAAQAKAASDKEILDKANGRIVRSEVKAAAKGVLADPQDAYRYLDIESFDVDDDGNVDEEAVAKAIADLVAERPYLAVQDGKRFKGEADGGARNGSVEGQLTEADVKRLAAEGKHEEIEAARATGRLNTLLGIK
jgi:hypothetical protein